MTREQIERAARIERENVHKELQENYRKHKDINLYTAFSATIDMYAVPLFKAGAQWRINSVWHSTDELPKYSGFLAVLMSNGLMEIMYYSAGIGFHEMTLKGYVLWAYISDLLPERKEETNGGR